MTPTKPPVETDTTAAEAYERHLVGPLFGPWAVRVVELGAPAPGEVVLDVACGTGIGARLAGPRVAPGGHVVSADSDRAMVAVARRLVDAEAPAGVTFEWYVAPAEDAIVADGSIDLCLCMQGLQFLDDPAAALARMRRALKPGGRLAASMWSVIADNKGHLALARALEARGLRPATKPFSLGDPQAAQAPFTAAGLSIARFETAEYGATYDSIAAFVSGVAAGAPATRHALAQLSEADRASFLAEIERLLAPYERAGGVTLPTRAHLVLARR